MEFTKDIGFSNVLKGNHVSKITYSGDLYKKGSETLSIVYGYGDNWEYTTEQEMIKEENAFSVEVEIKENFDTFNFCFKNNNNEWDNNGYANYISFIQSNIIETETLGSQELEADFVLEILDNILAENFKEENNKQQILDDILSENITTTNSTSLIEEFDMDELIETILNPVINYETIDEEFENIFSFEKEESDFLQELKGDLERCVLEKPSVGFTNLENSTVLAEQKESSEETSLIPTEDVFLVSPRKLRKFYLFSKKIKLAFYKLFVGIPKILFDSFEENKN